jgi:cytochrome c oxidase subunit 2
MALAILVVAVMIATVLLFVRPMGWLPAAISAQARAYDDQLGRSLWIIGLIFIAAHLLLAWVLLRHRDRGQAPARTEGSTRLEWIWTAATGVLFLGLAMAGQGIWAGVHWPAAQPEIRVEVLAKQFAWSFRYPGPDGVFGRLQASAIDDAGGNPFGIDSSDPAGKDDIVAPLLRVPAGRPVVLELTSRDVIHSFFVRELRWKQDVVPGMRIPLRLQADQPGTYEVPCTELCGLGHHQMRTALIAMAPDDFAAWLAEQR